MGLLRVWGARERLLAYLGREGVNDMTREGLCELKKQENGELSPWKWVMFFGSLKEWGLLINCRSGHDSEQVGKERDLSNQPSVLNPGICINRQSSCEAIPRQHRTFLQVNF